MVVGLWPAWREISANQYLAQGLWRTSLWLACYYSTVGAIAGAGAGFLMAVGLVLRRPRVCAAPPPEGPQEMEVPAPAVAAPRLGLVLMLSVALALAIVLLPRDAPEIFGVPSGWAFGVAAAVFWAVMSAVLLSGPAGGGRPADLPEGMWTTLVWLAYIVALSRLWARVEPGALMGGLACAGLLAVLIIYAALQHPVESLFNALSRRLQETRAACRVQRLAAALLAVGVLLWLGGGAVHRRMRAGIKAASRPNVLIIAVDTLRADRVSILSRPASGWDLTPNLREGLSRRGTYFTHAYSQAPWTTPSFASMFTGLYPEQHGAQVGASSLPPERLTVAEILRDRGYRTMAVVSGEYVSSAVAMLQGFDITDESQVLGLHDVTSAEVTNRALAMLAGHHDEPFFLFVHYFDPHYSYEDHPEFRFATGLSHRGLFAQLRKLRPVEDSINDSDTAQLKALYAEEVAFTDLHIGRLLAYLNEHHLWDSTCVVFVADHGEQFRDHGGFEHGDTLFNELVHVPLLVADPSRRAPAAVDDVVETRWLFGTILDMLGVPRPASDTSTYSIFAPPRGDYYVRSSLHRLGSCLIGQQYKLINGAQWPLPGGVAHRPGKGTASVRESRGRPAAKKRTVLFDLLQDPHETQDISDTHPDIAHHLSSILNGLDNDLSKRAKAAPTPALNRDQLRNLRDLGYLGD
jgi:arylsulfatase A-like enzyme